MHLIRGLHDHDDDTMLIYGFCLTKEFNVIYMYMVYDMLLHVELHDDDMYSVNICSYASEKNAM